MNNKRLLSLCLCAVVSMGLFTGCGKTEGKGESGQESISSQKVEEVKETAFETVPENALIPDYVKSRYVKEAELLEDYSTFQVAFWGADGLENPRQDEVLKRYGLSLDITKFKEVRDQNPEFVEGAIPFVLATSRKQTEMMPFVDEMIVKAQDYLKNSLLGEENQLDMSKEFQQLKPVEFVQNYLKKNNINITNVVLPDDMKHFHIGSGTNVVGLEFTVEGTQDGKEFTKTIKNDFHFAASQDLRDGADLRGTDNMSLMAVTSSAFEGANTWNIENLKKLF